MRDEYLKMNASTENEGDSVSKQGNLESTIYTHRNIGNCISNVLGIYSSKFLHFSKYLLPALIPFSLVGAHLFNGISNPQTITSSLFGMVEFFVLLAVLVILFSLTDAAIANYQVHFLHQEEKKKITLVMFYRKTVSVMLKSLAVVLVKLIYFAIMATSLYFLVSIDTQDLGPSIIKYTSTVLLFLVFLVFAIPLEIAESSVLLGKENIVKNFVVGYKIGFGKIGRVFSLRLSVVIIGTLVFLLAFSPAIVISMILRLSSQSIIEGDAVTFSSSLSVLLVILMILSVFLSSYIIAFIKMPMNSLFGSLSYDIKNTPNEIKTMIK